MFQLLLKPVEGFCSVLNARVRRVCWKHLLFDLPLLAFCGYFAVWLRLERVNFPHHANIFSQGLLVYLGIKLATFVAMGVYDILWRYTSVGDIILIVKAVFVSWIIHSLVIEFGVQGVPSGVLVINAVLLTLALPGVRLLRRYLYEYPSTSRIRKTGRPTLIYGAGRNGVTIAGRLLNDDIFAHRPVGFIDDDPQKTGRVIAGLPVLGTIERLGKVLDDYKVSELIIAVSKPSGDLLSQVLKICLPRNLRPRLIKVADGVSVPGSQISVLRDIQLDDLLSRQSRSIDLSELKDYLKSKVVLITGAGGSIGSELARQIFHLNPAQLLILDHSEYGLYEVDKDLRANSGLGKVIPLLVDVKNRPTLESVFRKYRPEVVFHAAAYKHVHLVEANPLSTILNNIHGTMNLVELAVEHGVSNFILISTDKAVNPGGVMGATKRVCELLVSAAGEYSNRRFASVRFGNVLGSSGSLIPLLKDQVSQGKPVTVTHPDMKRYFMLIPEAVSLVLRASMLARTGDIMVLKMGEPVRIIDLAKSLILLMGKSEKEIPIVVTGMRPGEKLQEELYLTGAEENTSDPDVIVVPRGDRGIKLGASDYRAITKIVWHLVSEAQQGNPRAVDLMWKLVHEGVSVEGLDDNLIPTIPQPWETANQKPSVVLTN